MGILKNGAKQGLGWVRDCLGLFRQNPAMWMLLSLAYILLFVVIPAINILPVLIKLLVVIFGPFFIVLALSLYREADAGRDTDFSDIVREIKPRLSKLIALGGVCLVYGILVSMVTSGDMQAINEMAAAQADPEAMAARVFPLMLKLLLLLTPIFMATWFSPMLIAHHDFSVFKAIKSSIAGSLAAVISLTVAWLLFTIGLALSMMLAGVIVSVIRVLAAPLGNILGSLMLFGFLLLATSLMLSLQYVSYRDVFARKMGSSNSPAPADV